MLDWRTDPGTDQPTVKVAGVGDLGTLDPNFFAPLVEPFTLLADYGLRLGRVRMIRQLLLLE